MAGKIYIGNSTISKMYLGQNEVSKVYLGQDLVYEKSSPSVNYSFSLTLNWGRYSPEFTIYDGQDNTGTILGTITHNNLTLSSTCTTGYLFVEMVGTGGYAPIIMNADWVLLPNNPTNMTITNFDSSEITLQITGDNASGTITFELD